MTFADSFEVHKVRRPADDPEQTGEGGGDQKFSRAQQGECCAVASHKSETPGTGSRLTIPNPLRQRTTYLEVASGAQACSALIRAIEKHQAELVEVLGERQRAAETRAQGLVDELMLEISDLQRRNDELQHLEHTENHLHLLQVRPRLHGVRACQNATVYIHGQSTYEQYEYQYEYMLFQCFVSLNSLPSPKDWTAVRARTDNCMGTVRRAVSKLVDICGELERKLSAQGQQPSRL